MAGSGGANGGEIKARLLLDSDDFSRKMDKAKNDMEDTAAKSAKSKKAIEDMGKGATIAGLAIVAGIGAAVKTAADFEQQLAKTKAVTSASASEMQQLKAKAIELGAATTFSSSQAAEAMTYLGMAGFTTQQIIDAMPATLNLAGAAAMDLGQAAEITSNIMSAFSLSAKDTTHAADVLAKAANSTNVDVKDLGETMKYVGPVAKGVGWSLEQTAAGAALLSNYGIKGSDAGTALRAVILSLAAPVGQTAKELKTLGLNVKDTHGNLLPLPDLIGKVSNSMKGMSDTQKIAAASNLVGREAASAFVALLNEGRPGIDKMTESLKHADGTAQQMANTMNDTLNGDIQQLQGAVESAAIQLGDKFSPALRSVAGSLTEFINGLAKVDPNKVEIFLKVAGTSIGILAAAGAVAKLGGAMKLLFVEMGPVGWAIAGISALAGAYMGIKTANEQSQRVDLQGVQDTQKKINTIKDLNQQYDEMHGKLGITTAELIHYRDLQREAQMATDPAKVRAYTAQLEDLQKKSGLTKDELQRYLDINDKIIATVPESARVIGNHGDAMLTDNSAAKALNDELERGLIIQLKTQANKAQNNAEGHLNDYKGSLNGQSTKIDSYNQAMKDQENMEREILWYTQKVNESKASGNEAEITARTIKLSQLKVELEAQKKVVDKQGDGVQNTQKDIEAKRKVLEADKLVYDELIKATLAQVGLNGESSKAVDIVDQSIAKLQTEATQLEMKKKMSAGLTFDEQKRLDLLTDDIKKHEGIKNELVGILGQQEEVNTKVLDGKKSAEGMQEILSRTAIKNIEFPGDPWNKARDLQRTLEQDATKTVHFNVIDNLNSFMAKIDAANKGIPSFMLDPNYKRHEGGTLPKLHTGGSPSFFNGPKANEVDVRLLRNELVLTEGQQASLFAMIKDYSTLADKQTGEGGKSDETSGGTVIQIGQLVVREEADVKKIAEELDRLDRQKKRSKGVR